jgi:glycosyltransferase involved in cell wall biosynthesis/predicted metal-dependent phosphoesterase TrpH
VQARAGGLPAAATPECRADLHCHSTASAQSRLGVQRSVGIPECATPPEEAYDLAKRRGMDFVTITDHDTIAGVVELADRPDVFVSEELTASFRGEPQEVHVLCLGITPDDHEWLQAHHADVEQCATYMRERDIACALAHPYYNVGAPLSARHRRRLASLFDVWEVRNGGRPRELNRPAAIYIATLDGAGVGGSDDHAGIDIGRTWTRTPPAASVAEFLAHVRRGEVASGGEHGSAAKWAHAAIGLALRTLHPAPEGGSVDPGKVMRMVQRLLREGDARHGAASGELTPRDASDLLEAWLRAMDLDSLDARALIELMQAEGFRHADLYRRACRVHEQRLREAIEEAALAARGEGSLGQAAVAVFESCIAVLPYAPARAFHAAEQAKLESRCEDGETPRIAILADGIGSTHGVTRVVQEVRRRGVRGFEIEVVGTDPEVDRRLPAVAEIEVPHYPGLRIGVPSLAAAVHALAEGSFDAIHVCAPGPAGIAGALVSRGIGVPLLGSYHTELTAYAKLRSGMHAIAEAMSLAVGTFYKACEVVLSPSEASDAELVSMGVDPARIARWDRGVDTQRFSPALRDASLLPGEISVLYSGRITREKGAELLADAFLRAREEEPRLHLVLAGGGPEEDQLRERLGDAASFLGWLEGADLARAYASADVFLFASTTDTFGQVILEAQASGLPVIAVDAGGPASLVAHRRTGLLCTPHAGALAQALLELTRSPRLAAQLSQGGLEAAAARTWDAAFERLAAGYRVLLDGAGGSGLSRAA